MATEDDEIERLRAERDELASQLSGEKRQRRHRIRRVLALVVALLGCLFLALAPLAIWTRTLVFDSDRWVEVVGPLAEEPAVQEVLATRVTDELMDLIQPQKVLSEALPDRARFLAIPLSGALENFARDRVQKFMATDDFARLWDVLVEKAHQRAIRVLEGDTPNLTVEGKRVTLDLIPVINQVLNGMLGQVPQLLGRDITLPKIDLNETPGPEIRRLERALGVTIPTDFGQVVVYEKGKLQQAQDAFDILRKSVVLIVVLGILLPLIALALSPDRRRTGIVVALGTTVFLVLIRRGLFLFRDQVLDELNGKDVQGAVDRMMQRLFDRLFVATAWMVGIGVLIGVVLWIVGPSKSARRLRSAVAHAGRSVSSTVSSGASHVETDRIVDWVVEHATGVRIAIGVVGLWVLWVTSLGWLGVLVLIALVAAAELVVGALSRRDAPPAAS